MWADVFFVIWKIVIIFAAAGLSIWLWFRAAAEERKSAWLVLAWLPLVLVSGVFLYPLTAGYDRNEMSWLYTQDGPIAWPVRWFWIVFLVAVALLALLPTRMKMVGGLLGLFLVIAAILGIPWFSLFDGMHRGFEPFKISIAQDGENDLGMPVLKADLGNLHEELGIDQQLTDLPTIQKEGLQLDWGVFPLGVDVRKIAATTPEQLQDYELVGAPDSNSLLTDKAGLTWAIPPHSIEGPVGTYNVYLLVQDENKTSDDIDLYVAIGTVQVKITEAGIKETGATGAAATSTAGPVAPACAAPSWQMEVVEEYPGNVFDPVGTPAIGDALTNPESREAVAGPWVDAIRDNPYLVAGIAEYYLDEEVGEIDPLSLVTANNCASTTAIVLVDRLREFFRDPASVTITPDDPPANATNTGLDHGDIVRSSRPGLYGNPEGVGLTTADGRINWIQEYCDQFAFLEVPADMPVGDTDTEERASASARTTPTTAATTSQAPAPDVPSTPVVDTPSSEVPQPVPGGKDACLSLLGCTPTGSSSGASSSSSSTPPPVESEPPPPQVVDEDPPEVIPTGTPEPSQPPGDGSGCDISGNGYCG